MTAIIAGLIICQKCNKELYDCSSYEYLNIIYSPLFHTNMYIARFN